MRVVTVLRMLVYCCLAVPASAQVTFANIRTQALPTVYVLDRAGHETAGQLVSLGDLALVLKTATVTRTFEPSEVSRLDRKGDSLKNGTLIGLAFGVFTAGAMAQGCAHYHCGASVVPYMLFGTGVYAAIGAGIDALIPGRTRIWPGKPAKTPGGTVQ